MEAAAGSRLEPGHGRAAVPGRRGVAGHGLVRRCKEGGAAVSTGAPPVAAPGDGAAARLREAAPVVAGLPVLGVSGPLEGGDGRVGDGVDGLHRVGDQQGGGVGEGVPGQVGGAQPQHGAAGVVQGGDQPLGGVGVG